MLKNIALASLLALTASTAQAAIMVTHFACVATHAPGRTFPIPDAPSYSLTCNSYSAISGSGMGCTLEVHNTFPAGDTEEPLQMVSETRTMATFRDGDTVVHVNKAASTAEIKVGNEMETECSNTLAQ